MRVFVTGVNGYIGAVLAPYLMERGMKVVGLDTGYYRDGWLYSDNRRCAATPLHPEQGSAGGDRRRISPGARLSCIWPSSPTIRSARTIPTVTHQINHRGSVALAQQAAAGRHPALRLHLFVQRLRRRHRGISGREPRRSIRRPPTRECKVLVERDLRRWPARDFCAGVPAQCDRVRPVAAHALRHRAQRSVRARLDHAHASR